MALGKLERYRGELREGMRVMIADGEHVIRRCNGEWRAYDENGYYWPLKRLRDGSWGNDFAHIFRVISEPKEEPKTTTAVAKLKESEYGLTFQSIYEQYVKHMEKAVTSPNWMQIYRAEFDITNSPSKGVKKPMAILKKATNLIKGLSQPLKNYVRLGWVKIYEDEYFVTEEGKYALAAFMFGLTNAKDLADYAAREVRRLKKEAKDEEDEE